MTPRPGCRAALATPGQQEPNWTTEGGDRGGSSTTSTSSSCPLAGCCESKGPAAADAAAATNAAISPAAAASTAASTAASNAAASTAAAAADASDAASDAADALRPPAVPPRHAVPIQTEEELNWPERQRLATLRSLRPPSEISRSEISRSEIGDNASDASVSSRSCGGGSVLSGKTGCCAKREAVLWRTLRQVGMVSSTPSPPPGPAHGLGPAASTL